MLNSNLNYKQLNIKVFFVFLFFSASIFAQGFKFVIMSDSRGHYNGVNEPVLSAFVNDIVENHKDVKFILFAGDMIDGSWWEPEKTISQIEHWKEVMAPIYDNPNMIWPKVWPVVGNHEIRNRKDEEGFRKAFQNVYMNGPDDEKGLSYSFDFGNAHFTVINTDRWYYGAPNDTTDDRPAWHRIHRLDWVEKDLKAARERGIKRIFTVSHEMAFPVGGHLQDGLPNLGRDLIFPLDSARTEHLEHRDDFWNLLKKYDVDAHLCGHEHTYGRQSVDGIYQIIAGSAGAPLYHQNPKYGEETKDTLQYQEFTYTEALPYFKALDYNYGPGKKSQRSENFVGAIAFNYVIIDVQDDYADVVSYGIFPKEGTYDQIDDDYKIIVLDKFRMEKTLKNETERDEQKNNIIRK